MLTEEQKKAVVTKSKKVLVLAGAGTGKTRVLTNRVKYLLKKKVQPESIVAITYTNMATNEMKSRLSDVEGIERCFIGTIHSFANNILRSMGKYFKILSDDEIIKIASKLIDKQCKHLNRDKFVLIKDCYDKIALKIKETSILDDYSKDELKEFNCLMAKDYIDYIKVNIFSYAKKHKYITFDEIINLATKYFIDNHITIKHLLIDEVQDIGMSEYNFIRKVNPKYLYTVGDDWQSIFSFNGSNVSIMKSMYNDKDFEVLHLTRNFRNPKFVLDKADVILRMIKDKITKDNTPERHDVTGMVCMGNRASLPNYIKKGCTILVRSNKEYAQVIEKLKNDFPYYEILDTKGDNLSKEDIEKELDSDKIKVMTVHQSKGLEFKDVIIFSESLKIYNRGFRDSDEEKRVMYVAITRAKESLTILN